MVPDYVASVNKARETVSAIARQSAVPQHPYKDLPAQGAHIKVSVTCSWVMNISCVPVKIKLEIGFESESHFVYLLTRMGQKMMRVGDLPLLPLLDESLRVLLYYCY